MDMATCHYGKNVIEWLTENCIDFVKKVENVPKVPMALPIERFWALCKTEYNKRQKPAKNLQSFRKIWSQISKNVACKSGPSIVGNVRKNLWKIAKQGMTEPLK